MSRAIAIIPARGGSKRIPRKNIRPFLGKPIINYSIRAALDSNCFDTVMVSTDDDEIALYAQKEGAEVPFRRSKKNSSDHAVTADVITEVLHEYGQRGETFSYACCLYPTAPFVTGKKLREGFELLLKWQADSVVPVVRFSFPIQRAFRMKGRRVVMFQPKHLRSRSQDLEAAFHDAGQFYWLDVKKFRLDEELFTRNTYALEVSSLEVQDIDTMEDWKMAEIKMQIIKESKSLRNTTK